MKSTLIKDTTKAERIALVKQWQEPEDGCLSLEGVRKTTRYEEIEVEYQDATFKKQKSRFAGWTAQIIQHEVDHLVGLII